MCSHTGSMSCLLVSGSRLLRLMSFIRLLSVSVSRLLRLLLANLCFRMSSSRLLVICWGVGCISTRSFLLSVAGMSVRRLIQKVLNTSRVSAMLMYRLWCWDMRVDRSLLCLKTIIFLRRLLSVTLCHLRSVLLLMDRWLLLLSRSVCLDWLSILVIGSLSVLLSHWLLLSGLLIALVSVLLRLRSLITWIMRLHRLLL